MVVFATYRNHSAIVKHQVGQQIISGIKGKLKFQRISRPLMRKTRSCHKVGISQCESLMLHGFPHFELKIFHLQAETV